MSSQRKRLTRRLTGCGLLILLPIAIAFFFFYRCANPPDRVRVQVLNLPADVTFTRLVVEIDGTPWAMSPYAEHLYHAFTIKVGSRSDQLTSGYWGRYQWPKAQRYGVVMRSSDLKWRVVWFTENEVPFERRLPLLGGGEVTLDVAKSQLALLPDEHIKGLELDSVSKPD